MSKQKNVIYTHEHFKNLSKEKLDAYLNFAANVLFNLNGFDVWEAENVFSEEDEEKWDKEVIERYNSLIEERNKLDDKINNQ